MKKYLAAVLILACITLEARVKYDSFENGVPKHWSLQGRGKLSTNPWHYKLGKKSLQWDFAAGDIVRVDNTFGDITRRGGLNNMCFAGFGIWVYLEKAMPGKYLRFEFRKDDCKGAYFDFPLNFKGWQGGFLHYGKTRMFFDRSNERSFSRIPDKDVNNILIKAPADADGRVLIDLVLYNGMLYEHINFLPLEKPWQPPRLDEKKNPLPGRVSEADLKAINKIKKHFGKIKIDDRDSGKALYNQIMTNIKNLDIVEDSHGIRGRPINIPRWHSRRSLTECFYTDNGIASDQLLGFQTDVLLGARQPGHKGRIIASIQTLKRLGITQAQYRKLGREYIKLLKYLIDQGFNCSYGNGYYHTRCYKEFIVATYLLREFLFKSDIKDEIVDYLQYKHYAFLIPMVQRPSMDYFCGAQALLYGVFLYSDDPLKQLQILRFMAKKWSNEILDDKDPRWGFKPDGSGYHGHQFKFDYYKKGLREIALVARMCANSSFAFSDEAFQRLKKAALNEYFYTNYLEAPIFMQGTSPFELFQSTDWDLPQTLKNLALAGKGGVDRELAQAYVNTKKLDPGKWRFYKPYDNIFERKYHLKPSAPPSGNISMPYAFLSVQRRNGWLAAASGNNIDMRDRGNRYMYHGCNGALSIIGKDGFFASGNQLNGWDWNRINGTTCLYMTDLMTGGVKWIMHGRKGPANNRSGRLKLKKWASRYGGSLTGGRMLNAGGISWRGRNGCFSVIFAGDKLFNIFHGIKSYFFINDRIYALGSDISSADEKYHVQTNIYQKALAAKTSATFVNGKKVAAFPVADKALGKGRDNYLIDSVGNGYYVPAGQKLLVARKEQKSRNTKYKKHFDSVGDFATAWIDHGLKPDRAAYHYVIMPYCDREKFAKFSTMDYEILRQDGAAHIIHDKKDNIYGAVFFTACDTGRLPHVRSVQRACQIMYQLNGRELNIAVGSHQYLTELKPLRIRFAGKWRLKAPVDGVNIISSDKNTTVIEFACIYGKTFNFTLQ